ncbi:MAG: diguanylate cyclase [bacterium]|nr:diguanylate cyclase [bacterium]
MKYLKYLAVLVLLVSLNQYHFAFKYPIINYGTSVGLPQNRINALIQGELGYILVGTQSGIGKFDGEKFQVITKRNGLPHNYITDFEKDDNHNLWVATQGGLCRINENQNTFVNYLTSTSIRSLEVDAKENLLWIVADHQVYYFKNKTLKKYDIITEKIVEKTGTIIGLAISKTGIKYFYTQSAILAIDGTEITTIESRERINCLKQVGTETLVGTENGLFLLKNQEMIKYIDMPPRQKNITDIAIDNTFNLWLGTTNGVFHYDKKEDKNFSITKKNGLVFNYVLKILIDKENNIFIGTQWGLSQLSMSLFKMYDTGDGLPQEFLWCFEEDNDSILMGCDLGIVELKNGKINELAISNRLKKIAVRAIVKIKENDFLLGARNNGVFRWDRGTNLEQIHKTSNILSAQKNNSNNVWLGTDNGLLKYAPETNTFSTYNSGLKDKNIWCLSLLDNQTVLIGTDKGVQKIYKGKPVTCRLEEIIGEEIINDIKVISKSEVLVATELNGVYMLKERKLTHLTTDNYLLHNDVWAIIKDNNENIWINTSVSLDRYNNGFISHFNKQTGLFGDEGNLHSVFKNKEGKLYFGIAPGFVEISPQQIVSDIPSPKLFINKIEVNGKKVKLRNLIELPHNQNTLEFHYIAVSTRKENPVFYITRLSPFEKEWSPANRNTDIKYLNLPPGQYTFEVEANNNGGGKNQWIKSKNKIIIHIAKPFWLKWWFILMEILIALLLILLIVNSRIKALEKQKKKLEEIVELRTEEIVEKNKELAHLSITDHLTGLKNRRYLEEKIHEDISLIKRQIYENSIHSQKKTDYLILGVFILDIDHFKNVNDTYGHKAGDIVISDTAKLLQEMLRTSDTIVRWGGEEFLIITRQIKNDDSFELAERIREKIAQHQFKIGENLTIYKTISIGFSHFPFVTDNTETVIWPQVLSLTDSALYIAKKNGRNQTVGIKKGEKTLDGNAKEIVSDIEMGLKKHYLAMETREKNLKIPQHKQ